MKNFKRIIIALIVACVIITSCPISESIVDAATIKVKSGANVTEVKGSGKKYVAYRGKQAVKPKKGWYKKGSTQYYFDGKKNYATYVWYKKSDKWYLKKWNKSKKAYEKYTGTKQLSNGKIYYFKKGKKANGIVKKSGKYCYYKGGKQTAYSTSKGAWKKVSKTTKVYFDKGNKSATYAMYKNTLKKWNKTTKTYVKYTGKKRLDDNKIYYFNKGKKYTGARKGTNGKFYKCKNGKNTSTLANGTMVYTDGKCYSFKNGEKVGKFTGINGGKYYKNGVEQSVAAGTEVTDNGKRLVYSDNKWIALTGKGSDNCFYVKGIKANGIHEFDNVYYSCTDGKGTKLDGIQKTGGKYYYFSKGIKGDAVDGITPIENKYYVFDEGTKGEAADGIKKLDGYYYKFSDGVIAILKGWNGKHYYNKQYQITYKKDDNLVYKWSKSKWELFTGTLAGVEYENGAEKTDTATPGDFPKNPKAFDKCVVNGKCYQFEIDEWYVYTGEYDGRYYKNGDPYTGEIESCYYENGVPYTGMHNKLYYKNGKPYTGEYEGKLYESGKAVDYKVRTKSGDLFTGWAIYEDVIPNAATEFYHLTTGYSHNLVYVENGIVKQYYVYEKMEDHSWCNGCGADMEVSPYWSSAGVNPALDDHKEHDHPQFDHQSFNGGPVYKYTNNGKTYWVTASNGREYRWTGTEYVPYWNVGGTECLDTSLPKELTHLNDTGKIPDVVYSSDDWKIGQCSIVLVNKDVVLK